MTPKTTLKVAIKKYCDELAISGQAFRTIDGTRQKLNRFARFAKAKRVATIGRISQSLLFEYRHDLHVDRNAAFGWQLCRDYNHHCAIAPTAARACQST